MGYITPLEFAQQANLQTASNPGCDFSRPTASLRHSLDWIYHLEQLIHPARLTQAMGNLGHSTASTPIFAHRLDQDPAVDDLI